MDLLSGCVHAQSAVGWDWSSARSSSSRSLIGERDFMTNPHRDHPVSQASQHLGDTMLSLVLALEYLFLLTRIIARIVANRNLLL